MLLTDLGEKVIAYDYREVILRLQLLDEIVNILKVFNVSQTPDLSHNFFSTISLAKKGIEVFLRRTDQLSEIFFEDELVGLADMIDNQYIIRLTKPLIPKVNIVKNPTPEIWHIRLGYLSYKVIQKLSSVVFGMQLKDLISLKICGGCMISRQQRQPSQESVNWQATKFLEFVHSDLGGLLPAT